MVSKDQKVTVVSQEILLVGIACDWQLIGVYAFLINFVHVDL